MNLNLLLELRFLKLLIFLMTLLEIQVLNLLELLLSLEEAQSVLSCLTQLVKMFTLVKFFQILIL